MANADYKVAVELSLINNVSRGLKLIGGEMLGLNKTAASLQDKFKGLGLALAGFGMDRAGQGLLGFMGKAIDASKEYTRQISLMNAAGMSQTEVARSVGAAWKASHEIMTSSAADNLQTLRELRTVFYGRMEEAYGVLPQVQRATAIMEALTGRKQDGVGFDMVKAIERRSVGNVSGPQLQANAELMTRAMLGMSGTVTANDFHQALSKAKLTALTMNDDFVYKYLPTLIQINKGGGGGGAQQAGTQLATAARAIVQGRMLKSMFPMWIEMGQIKASDVVHNAGGSVSLRPGAVKNAALFQANPFAYANELAPAAMAYGQRHHMSLAAVLLSMFSDRNAANLIGSMILQKAHFDRDAALIQSVGTSKQGYDALMKMNPQMAEQALHSQWQNVLSILGYQILPKLLPLMVRFANGLDRVGQFMEHNQRLTKGLAVGMIGLGGALTIVGKGMMAAGMIKFLGLGPTLMRFVPLLGPLGLGIAAAGAAAFMAYRNWDKLCNIMTAIDKTFPMLATGFNAVLNFLSRIGSIIWNHTIGGAFSAVQGLIDGADHWATGVNTGHPAVVPTHRAPVHVTVINKVDKNGISSMVLEQFGRNQAPTSGAGVDTTRHLVYPSGGRW